MRSIFFFCICDCKVNFFLVYMWLQGSILTNHLRFLTPSKNLLVFIGGLFIELMEKDLGLIPKNILLEERSKILSVIKF